MTPQPYINVDQDIPNHSEPRVGECLLCGEHGYVFVGAIELPDGKGGYTYANGDRCVETADCRARRHALGKPLEPAPPTPPDTKEPNDGWI